MTEKQANTDIREIAGAIIASYLENNQMPADQVPQFIHDVTAALRGEAAESPAEEALQPAVPVKKSVGPDHVTCLVCGKQMKALKRHIRSAHGMSEGEYREAFNLTRDHPLVSRNYSRERADMAKRIGLGQKAKGRGRAKKKA